MTMADLARDIIARQRRACAAAIDAYSVGSDMARREVRESIARDVLHVEPLILSVPLSGPLAGDLLAEIHDDGGLLSSLPMLTRMACVQYVLAVADHSAEALRPVLYALADLVRSSPLVEPGYARSLPL